MLKILVTGASSGIGKATALHLAQKGHQVLIAARRVDKLQQMAAESPSVVGEFIVGELDVSSPDSIARFVKNHHEWLTQADVLINNAGLAIGRESLEKSSSEELKAMVDTNVWGVLEMTRVILPFMIQRKKGHIVNMGSIAAKSPYQGGTTYCATKAAIHAMTEALRQDLAGTGIRVSTVAPGRVAETEFSTIRFRGDEEKARALYQGYRAVTARDIAEAISWIIEQPQHVNIQELVIMPTDQPTSTTVVPLRETRE